MPTVFANSTKYLCSQNMNHLYVIFDKKKKVASGNDNPKKYWTEGNNVFGYRQ